MLKLIDLIRQSRIDLDLGRYKIHCATDNKRSDWRPLEAYFAGTFEDGQASQSQPNFQCDHVVSLINLGDSKRWLFVGVYHVDGVPHAKGPSEFIYSLTRVPGLEHLEGRAIVDFQKKFRNSYLVGANHEDQLVVHAIREQKLIADFPGFNRVRVSFEMLVCIIGQNNPSWRAALANVAGVYLIVDCATGRQYVGSAYGGVGLWQRWSTYIKKPHGGNKKLRQLLKRQGVEYAKNFQFSLLEYCDIAENDVYVRARESHWQDVLLTRKFGLN